MNYSRIIQKLSNNQEVYKALLLDLNEEEYLWKQKPSKWCLLEIVCHLYDEEREDFRARVGYILNDPSQELPPIDPTGWVHDRKYIQQDFQTMLNKFLLERRDSIKWLESLKAPQWHNSFEHDFFGEMSAKMFLANWLAHDQLHIKQILKLKFDYLKVYTHETLIYAGKW